MVPPPFQTEGAALPNGVPAYFERFYRETLRRVIGSRVRSSSVHAAYSAWAIRQDAQSLNYHQLRRYMLALGHARLKSNGIQYVDAAFAIDVPDIADTFALVAVSGPAGVDVAVEAIDGATAALKRLRAALTGAA